ncbi:MAG: type II toxin-antitoxin system prevent-host-death family antitoxin [Magnetococcales bacterium]|nr:type II toxin-antitoxin system prevent-host-death family antitoxin [Magnetococcales bacterium]
MNQATTYSSFRGALKSWFDQVCNNHEPLLVTRKTGEDIVILSYSDYSALEETAYLLRSPKNAQRILNANNDIKNGSNIEVKELIE